MAVVAALLAAGGGARFHGSTHKLLTEVRGRRIVDWAHAHAIESGLEVIVVSGAVPLGLPNEVHNPSWRDGMATSMQVALAAAGDVDAVVIGLGDQPGVVPEAWRLVADAPDAPIAIATYDGERGNPVRLRRDVWPLLPATGDVGARKIAREQPSLVTAVACPGDPNDVDTVEDLDRWS
ncbi:MAG TPA: NTP transferase domain-containing protein [Acidimicrobiales bacterium]|nr:NTP transferase domain-containing protein [Acidimicrobiales bacterium]